MGMSTHVTGLVSGESELYKKHSAVLRACIDAGVKKLPEETSKFFNSEYAEKYLFDEILEINVPFKEYDEDMEKVYEIKVSELDPRTDIIRFTNSW